MSLTMDNDYLIDNGRKDKKNNKYLEPA